MSASKNLYMIITTITPEMPFYLKALVVARDVRHAKFIHPNGVAHWDDDKCEWSIDDDAWCHPSEVNVMEIGVAADHLDLGQVVLCGYYEQEDLEE